jgi:hypothetical protein
MRYLFVILVACVACSESAPAEDSASGEYADINTDRGSHYALHCGSLAVCAGQAVRLLEQFVGDGQDGYRCRATDKDSRCFDGTQPHAFVKDCEKVGELEWNCGFGVSGMGGDREYGTVRLHNPAYRFEFWDGSVGVGDVATHAFVYINDARRSTLPTGAY